MVSSHKIWHLAGEDPHLRSYLAQELGLSPITAQVLINRGITTPAAAREFLAADLSLLHDPLAMKDMEQAVVRLRKAIAKGEPVLVYGDYDVDGISGTALLVAALRELGGNVTYYIPERLQEGYGLNLAFLEKAAVKGYSLVCTVDCGIAGAEEVAAGGELGLDFIITDHHQPQENLPEALAILNPKQLDCQYPFQELAGVGVAFKLVEAMGTASGYPREWCCSFLDLVALGTVADMVPLQGENRIFVKHGLKALQDSPRVGIKALLEVTGLKGRELTPGHIGFALGPRLNACGRLGGAARGVELLLTDDPGLAEEAALTLDGENRERQALEAEILEQAREQAEKELDLSTERVLVLGSPHWHQGVIGIVASRLVEQYYLPTILVSFQEEEGKGSARSIPGFHIFKALCQCQDILEGFGGHEQAAGLTVKRDKLPFLRQRLNELAWQWLKDEEMSPSQTIDAQVGLGELDFKLIEDLEKLAPFGMGNPEPVFACYRAQLLESRSVGRGGAHLKMKVRQRNRELDVIAFGKGDLTSRVQHQPGVNLAFRLQRNEWQGETSLQLVVRDLETVTGVQVFEEDRIWDIKDFRGRDQERTLLELLSSGDGGLVFVNTAENAVKLGRMLGENLEKPKRVALFHAGLGEPQRKRIVRELLDGSITLLVTTPFLSLVEGLENFRHVYWFDLNFNPKEFRRLCHLVGKGGDKINIHLLFGEEDRAKNRPLLDGLAPDRQVLAAVYLSLKQARRGGADGVKREGIWSRLKSQKELDVKPHTVSSALEVLEDLKLIRAVGNDSFSLISRAAGEAKLSLENSRVYCRKLEERNTYLAFQEFLLSASPAEISYFLQEGSLPKSCREEVQKKWT